MELIKRILLYPQCEVFSYLNYKEMNRWLSDPSKASSFTRAFGGDEWKQAINLIESERRLCLLELYKNALHKRAGVKYVCYFSMFEKNDLPLYWLIFSTNNLKGLEEMKKAMWKVDNTGEFKFSDKDAPEQLFLLNKSYDDDWLADELCKKHASKELSVAELKNMF